jgi:LDH2 family malate/lactate/ureidoglycolate dehydrogenase
MQQQSVRVPVKKLTQFIEEVLVAMAIPAEDAGIIADVIITSDLWGVASHGIAHLKMYHERMKAGLQLPESHWSLVKDTPTTAVIDGGNGMGMVIGHNAMKIAIQKARQFGLGGVAVRNSSHYGVAGYYALMAVQEGMVGISLTNAHPSIAPTFGVTPLLGTNPIAVAAPTDEPFPFLFDAATAVVTRGKIEVAAREGKPIPSGWVIGQNGAALTDTSRLIEQMNQDKAALMPIGGFGELMGGHKGYGLATMVEIFSAAFQNGAFLSELHDTDAQGNPHFLRIGHFFLAIDIGHFLPLADFTRITGDMMRELRGSQNAPDHERIYTAGEKEYYNTQYVMENGIEITPGVQRGLNILVKELNLPPHNLGF